MLPKPIEHCFSIDGEPYRLVEWTRGGERRLRAAYALAIASAPDLIEVFDGKDLYAEVVARECLKEAPEIFWAAVPTEGSVNGVTTMTPASLAQRVITLDNVPRALWHAFRKEVDAFLGMLFPPTGPEPPAMAGAGAQESLAVADVEAVSAVFRGRAE